MHRGAYTCRLIKQNAQRMAQADTRLMEATAVRSERSLAGVQARFLQRLADRIDPTGEARRRL